MGNFCSGPPPKKEPAKSLAAKQPPSWEQRKAKLNPNDYIVSKKKGEKIVKLPGSIAGQQFVIEECTDCDIYLFDYSATVQPALQHYLYFEQRTCHKLNPSSCKTIKICRGPQVDLCQNCHIFIGPCESSVFLRNCQDSSFIIACQQLRTRDCSNIQLQLYSQTEPVIEATNNVTLGCFNYNYFSLAEQMKSAKLSIWNNRWSEGSDNFVYDILKRLENTRHGSSNTTELSVVVVRTRLGSLSGAQVAELSKKYHEKWKASPGDFIGLQCAAESNDAIKLIEEAISAKTGSNANTDVSYIFIDEDTKARSVVL